jgi:hypothetical protein
VPNIEVGDEGNGQYKMRICRPSTEYLSKEREGGPGVLEMLMKKEIGIET